MIFPIHASPSSSVPNLSYWDNANSYYITFNTKLLYNLQPLQRPFTIEGICGGQLITHVGNLYCLPLSMNLCYYSSNISVTLFSLGYIHRHGGAYSTNTSPTTLHTKVYSSITLPPIEISTLSITNLLPINYQFLSTAAKLSPHLYYKPPISAYLNNTLPNPTHSSNCSSNSNNLLTLTQSTTPYIPSPTRYFNPEQRKRAEDLEALHIAVFHPGDNTSPWQV
jgi:hypothetical protein